MIALDVIHTHPLGVWRRVCERLESPSYPPILSYLRISMAGVIVILVAGSAAGGRVGGEVVFAVFVRFALRRIACFCVQVMH